MEEVKEVEVAELEVKEVEVGTSDPYGNSPDTASVFPVRCISNTLSTSLNTRLQSDPWWRFMTPTMNAAFSGGTLALTRTDSRSLT